MKKEKVYEIIFRKNCSQGVFVNATGICFTNEESANSYCEKYSGYRGGIYTYSEKYRFTYETLEDYERMQIIKRNNLMKAHAENGRRNRNKARQEEIEIEKE